MLLMFHRPRQDCAWKLRCEVFFHCCRIQPLAGKNKWAKLFERPILENAAFFKNRWGRFFSPAVRSQRLHFNKHPRSLSILHLSLGFFTIAPSPSGSQRSLLLSLFFSLSPFSLRHFETIRRRREGRLRTSPWQRGLNDGNKRDLKIGLESVWERDGVWSHSSIDSSVLPSNLLLLPPLIHQRRHSPSS